MSEPAVTGKGGREPILNPVDRISEMLFGLFMALTFIGAVSVAGRGQAEVRTLFVTAIGCNLAWGLVDAVMYLVRTATGSTFTDLSSETAFAAITAPTAMPSATTPCSTVALSSGRPSALSAHFSTMNCSVAPAPQNRVVTASEICPSLSRQSRRTQCQNSCIR